MIHYSEISSFLTCSQKHKYNYIDEVVPREVDKRIDFGTFGHEVLKVFFRKSVHRENIVEFMFDKFPDADPTALADACLVGIRAFDHFQKYELEPVFVEQTLSMNIEGIDFAGTADLVCKDKMGNYWLIDHKFRKSFLQHDSEYLNLQMIFYHGLLAMSEANIHIAGSAQYQIKPFAPKEPELTKTGKLSKMNIDTDWATYYEAIKKYNLDPADYSDMPAKLDNKVWFDLETTRSYRKLEQVKKVWDTLIIPTAKKILARPDPARCFNWFTCKSCMMKEYCIEDLNGGDLVFLQSTSFKKKSEPDVLEVVFEDED